MSGQLSSRYPDNVSRAVFARELSTGRPGTMVHRMRSMYQVCLRSLVMLLLTGLSRDARSLFSRVSTFFPSRSQQVMPNKCAHNINAPDCHWLSFSSDGQFLLGIR